MKAVVDVYTQSLPSKKQLSLYPSLAKANWVEGSRNSGCTSWLSFLGNTQLGVTGLLETELLLTLGVTCQHGNRGEEGGHSKCQDLVDQRHRETRLQKG